MVKQAIQSVHDQSILDACLFYHNVFKDLDGVYLEQIATGYLVSQLASHLKSANPQIQSVALKALANLLTSDSNVPIDRFLFCKGLDDLYELSKQNDELLLEVCFCCYNISCGDMHHVQALLQH